MDVSCAFSKVFIDNSTINMENRDCLRRIARHEEPVFSNQSILNVMEKFVKSVNNMDETILVPSRLMDLKVGDANDTVLIKHSNNERASTDTDLFNLYTMINSVKNELLWSQKSDQEATDVPKGHVRRPSSVSLTSLACLSDTDSDSGIEAEDSVSDHTQQVADNFRHHLKGLYNSLEQMTEAATYLTTRYQNDVNGTV